jgi:hypothetical protein
MRRIMASALAAAAALLVVSTATAASPNSVTISLSRPSVVYGGTVTLSGKVSGAKSGEDVEVLAVPFGQTSFASLTTVQSTSGGHWSTAVKPTIETIYEAKWKGQLSSTVRVKVRPGIALGLKSVSGAIGTFSTTATAARSFAGKFVLVQRLVSRGATTLKKVTLDSNSSATFHVRLHGRSRLRVVMPTSQAAPGYITGFSNIVRVHR